MSGWKPPKDYVRMKFVAFCGARQAVLVNRRNGLPREAWTDDPVLLRAKFCNIDRRDDAVTAELLSQWAARSGWTDRERVLLAAALRFTGSRRGEAALLARLIEEGRDCATAAAAALPLEDDDGKKKKTTKKALASPTPLCAALAAGNVRCGTGTYQLSLNRKQVSLMIENLATAVVARVHGADGAFADVLEASDFVAEAMTDGKRPQFSANETAKDLAYVPGLLQPHSAHRCRLGPGARKGLALVRAEERGGGGGGGGDDEAVVARLRAELRAVPSLDWVESIDVEQALCEYSKYVHYCESGVSATKAFEPVAAAATDDDGKGAEAKVEAASCSKRKRERE